MKKRCQDNSRIWRKLGETCDLVTETCACQTLRHWGWNIRIERELHFQNPTPLDPVKFWLVFNILCFSNSKWLHGLRTRWVPLSFQLYAWDFAVINPGKDIQETFPERLDMLWNLEHIPAIPFCFLSKWGFPPFRRALSVDSPEGWEKERERGRM